MIVTISREYGACGLAIADATMAALLKVDPAEWVETVEAGWNRLWTNPDYAPRHEIAAYGDGHAAEKIADILASAV